MMCSNAKIFVSVRDLKYMIKGGRVSKPKGLIASVLGLNPVISMDENGKSLLFGKTFSQQASLKKIYKHIQKDKSREKLFGTILYYMPTILKVHKKQERKWWKLPEKNRFQ